ncbi:MAG: hypothetical protein LBH24_05045 [Clostridiales bacterium]|jgi:hypothetical protein|nr:hypothetical protein [Clostridiales bacterium]
MANTKKQNFFVRYFSNFGLKQLCDLAMIVGAIVLIVGLFVAIASVAASEIILIVGMGIYIAASAAAIYLSVRVLTGKLNHRSPEYKRAIANTVIMGILFALSVFGFIWALAA